MVYIMKPEEVEQKKTVSYLQILKNSHRIITFFAIENENKQSATNRQYAIRLAMKAKLMGKVSGVSDLCVIFKNHILFIEMKRPPKRLKSGRLSYSGIKVSDSQKEFIDIINKGIVSTGVVCCGFDEAKIEIDKYIGINNRTIS